MKKTTDYTLHLIAGILFFAAVVNLPACYNSTPTPKQGHKCKLVDCEMTGATTFKSDLEEGTDGYLFDLTHYNHPAWTYEECENFVFGYGQSINKTFDVPYSNCQQ